MLKLKGVSKFYYNKGLVASGFTKIDLDLDIGEFVAITGESGSGKSTLLNVISGLDTYEEGEMYINGEETSYYNENDFENYRKKYIANIFQNFNLVNSYTVYQNIELVLLINGYKREEIKNKIEDLLNKVDLCKYKNTKVSKLSGGQKQRVAIARALAKETPIIVADEPTGNLDSRSALSIMKLLYEVSKDKLVIVVTHNYEQVSDYVTRKIRMHDGKILEDVKIKKIKNEVNYENNNYGNLTFFNKLKLGLRNTFNIVPKFLLLLVVYLFLTLSVISVYSSTKKNEYDSSLLGYNRFFTDISDKRLILQKSDKSVFNEEDYKKIKEVDNVDYIIKNDLFLDMMVSLSDDEYYVYGSINELNKFNYNADYGRMPTSEDEVIVVGPKSDYYLNDEKDKILEKELTITDNNSGRDLLSYKLKIVGIKYIEEDNYSYASKIYVSNKVLIDLNKSINKRYSSTETLLNNKLLKGETYSSNYNLMPSDKVDSGKVIVSEDLSYYCKNYYCKNNNMTVTIKNLYYSESLDLTINNTYTKNSIERLTGYSDFDKYNGYMFINTEDFYSLYDKGNYQISVFLKDAKDAYNVKKEIESLSYNVLHVKDTLVNPIEDVMIFFRIIQLFGIGIAVITLFFISYFIIKIIMKSRNTYFSIVRILGASKKDDRMLLNIELNSVLNIAYLLVITFIILVSLNVLNITYIKELIKYLKLSDYIILYIILFIISVFISNKYAKKLFKSSAMKTYREEV